MSTNPELDPKLVDAPQAPVQQPAVNLSVDINELNVIFGALQELPHRAVDSLLKKLFQQAQSQLQRQ